MNSKIKTKVIASTMLCTMLAYCSTPVLGYTKDESVYSKLDANGKVYQTTVSNHLKNTSKLDSLEDLSDLMDIENVGGDQELKQDGNKITWKADDEDIYYQGTTNKELPIECKVTYKLDGKEISKEDIAGKSGKVKIIIEFKNKEKREVVVNGKLETMYVPFVVGVGTIVNNENHKNIKITNGKVIDNGNKSIVFGIVLPGMQESLGLSKNELELPSKVEISMEAKDFETKEIYCFASPKLIEEKDIEIFDKLDDIYGMANDLNTASKKLVDGSNKLNNGAKQLNSGMHQLSSSLNTTINEYENARVKLSNKKEIENEIVKIINSEMKELAPELEKLAKEEASNVIKENLGDIENKTVDTVKYYSNVAINQKLDEIKKNPNSQVVSKVLEDRIKADVKTAIVNVENNNENLKQLKGQVKNIVVAEVKQNTSTATTNVIKNEVTTMKNAISDPTVLIQGTTQGATLDAAKEQIALSMVPGIMASNNTLTQPQALEVARAKINEFTKTVSKTTMDTTLDNVVAKTPEISEKAVDMVASQIDTDKSITEAVENYADNVSEAIKQTIGEEAYLAIEKDIKNDVVEELKNTFKQDATLQAYAGQIKQELKSNVDTVADKTARKLAEELTEDLANQIASNLIEKQLKGELSESELDKLLSKYEGMINSKLSEVDSKVATLKSGLKQLTDGTDSLEKGSKELSNGMKKFDKEGISKIYSFVNGNVKDLSSRVQELKKLSNDYQSFTKIKKNEDGSVKFIMMIDGVSKEEAKREEAVLPASDDEKK